MNKEMKQNVKEFFKKEFADSIQKKTKDGYSLKDFNINPFSLVAISSGVLGKSTSTNMARTLIYPRALGTSISTTFGDKMQKFCINLGARASSTPGMDIEFTDKIDGNNLIIQLKAGPNTIKSGDVDPIIKDMQSAYRLLRQNQVETMPQFAIGVTYGTQEELSSHYIHIGLAGVGSQLKIPIIVGQEFWYRLTGDFDFYNEMVEIFVDLFSDLDFSSELEADITTLASEINERYFTDGVFDVKRI